MNYDEYIGKRMNWAEMKKLFPQMWVGVSDYSNINNDDFNGIIESVCETVQEKSNKRKKFFAENKNVYWSFVGDVAEGYELWNRFIVTLYPSCD